MKAAVMRRAAVGVVAGMLVAAVPAGADPAGGGTAPTTASRILPTSASFCIRAEPAMTLHTFLAGQPMLMSMICAP